MSGLIVSGDLYIGILDDSGNFAGYEDKVNCSKLEITNPDPDTKERVSRMKGTLGQALDVVNIAKPAEVSLTIDDTGEANQFIAMALLGRKDEVNQSAGNATDEAVVLIPGKWTRLTKRNIASAGFNLSKAATPSTSLVMGVDYKVNYEAGHIMAIEGGAITSATSCLADYSYSAVSGVEIWGGAIAAKTCCLLVEGENLANKKKIRLEIDSVQLSPSGGMDFMSGEFVNLEFSGKMKTLSGQDAAYRYYELSA